MSRCLRRPAVAWLSPVLLLLIAGTCQAEPVIQLSPHMDGIGTQLTARYLEDAGHRYSFAQVKSEPLASAFAPLPHGRSNLGISGSGFWLRLDVHNPADKPLSWFLEAGYPLWNHVDFYVGGAKALSGGDFEPFAGRPVAAESNVLPLTTPAGAVQRIWVHFSSERPLIAETRLSLWTPRAFYQHQALANLIIGGFIGIGIVLFFYNLFIGYSTRMFEYIWYTSYVFAAVMTMLSFSGIGYHYLWPGFHWFTNFAPMLFVTATVVLATQFTRVFLYTARELVVVDRLLLGVMALGGVTLLCYLAGLHGASIRLLLFCGFVSVFYPLIGVRQYRKGRREARFYVAAWSVWSLAMIIGILRHLGMIDTNLTTFFSPPAGFTIEAVLLSFALADRINRLSEEKAQIELTHIEHLRNEQETLEQAVMERTSELAKAKGHAEQMAMTDALTGLVNRRAFFEQGEIECERAGRDGTNLAVVMIDLDGFKGINDRHGHAAGDAVLVHVGGALRGMIRNVDTVGRIGGEEFAVLLPGADLQTATDLAKRLRKAFEALEISVGSMQLRVTASFGVAAIDFIRETFGEALHRADMALYSAKANGRNRVERA